MLCYLELVGVWNIRDSACTSGRFSLELGGERMMEKINDFRRALKFTLQWEVGKKPNGGYTNDPDDPGGETKYGICKRYHPNEDIKNMTPERAAQIYTAEYWDSVHCDDLDWPLNVVVFDSMVNPGVKFVVPALQKTKDPIEFLALRKQYYFDLVNADTRKIKYIKGWLNRLTDLRKLVDTPVTS
jgi:hypothetical protein